jgi:IS4 transposase
MLYTVYLYPSGALSQKGTGKSAQGRNHRMSYHPEDDTGKKRFDQQKTLRLRKVCYQDEKNRYYEFLTNNFDIEAEEVAFLYKKRWGIEILFKKMKQNFQLHYFYGENENAIRTQVWCTLIAQLLLTVFKR